MLIFTDVGPLVMFHARHLEGQHTYNTNQDVVFRTVIVNEGGGYDSNSGRFTASVAGVYMFTVQYCSSASNWAIPEIVHEGRSLQRSGHRNASTAVCTSMQACRPLLRLSKETRSGCVARIHQAKYTLKKFVDGAALLGY